MLDFSQERSVTYLRAVAQLQQEKIARLEKENEALRARLGESEAVAEENKTLQHLLERAREREFGRSSERQQSEKPPKKPRDPQSGHGPREQPGLETEVVEHNELPPEKQVCKACGGRLSEMGDVAEESQLITVNVRSYVRQIHRQKKFRCRCHACIETAPGPMRLVDGGLYAIEFGAEAAAAKYSDHLPLARQVRIMKHEGLVIDTQTLWDQLDALAKLLSPTYEAIIKSILALPVIGCDETRWYLLDNGRLKENRIWQSWCLWSKELVAYRIRDSRGMEAAASVLAGFTGVVMADAYTVYQSLARQTGLFLVALCWAHVRRRFIECQENFPAEAGTALTMIRALYAIEREGKAEGAELAALRDHKSRPIVDAFFLWAKELAGKELPRGGLGEALAYALNHEEGLRRFLEDARIPIDNNGTEAAQRGIVLGRNNHHGSRSRRGTEVAAIYYTLVECAKLVGVSPKAYIVAVAKAARGSPGAVLMPADFKAMLTAAV